MNKPLNNKLPLVLALALALALGGCAVGGNPRDPLENFNRGVFSFNEGLDKVVIKPLAQGYEAVLPLPVRTGTSNFFDNIADLFIAANNLLQGKVPEAATDVGRLAINSSLGILGLFDVASEMGLAKHEEDFGQTLGRWGVGDGPFLVLPVYGPRTTRDTVGKVLDVYTDPVGRVYPVATRNTSIGVRLVNDRAQLLPLDKTIDEAALDKYTYVRDAYLQRRRSLIHDGNAPRDKNEEIFDDFPATPAPKK